MDSIQLKQTLKKAGFKSNQSERYFALPLKNGWIINVEWQGESKYPVVQATHQSQVKATNDNPYYIPFDSNHLWYKAEGITANKRYIRNKESRTFNNQLVPMAIECLINRIK